MSALSILLPLVAAGQAAAAQPQPAPASTPETAKWIAKWEENGCSLVRTAGGSGGVQLRLEPSALAEGARISFADGAWSRDPIGSAKKASLVLRPRGVRLSGQAYPLSWDGVAGRGLSFNSDSPGLAEAFGASEGAALEIDGKVVAEIRYAGAAAALKSLRRCSDALLRDWGIDTARLAALSAMPKKLGDWNWADEKDFPDPAIFGRKVRRTTLRFTVGIDGHARDCVPVVGSGDRSIDARSCALMAQRARFSPALDRDGRPTEAQSVLSWVWVPIG